MYNSQKDERDGIRIHKPTGEWICDMEVRMKQMNEMLMEHLRNLEDLNTFSGNDIERFQVVIDYAKEFSEKEMLQEHYYSQWVERKVGPLVYYETSNQMVDVENSKLDLTYYGIISCYMVSLCVLPL